MGNRSLLIAEAVELIASKAGAIHNISPVFETTAWGKTDLPPHLNQAVLIETTLDALPLLDQLQAIENQLGRERQEHWGERTIDIDIIFFNNEVINSERLTIPHPYFQDRRFALVPMNCIAGDYMHPVVAKTVSQLLDECPDTLGVNLWRE